MASKRRSKLLENPPPASSSEEESDSEESEEEMNHEDREEEEVEDEVGEAEVEEEDDDDDDDDEETIKSRFSVKKYVSEPNPHHQSSSDSESDSENQNPKSPTEKPKTTVVFGKRPTSGEPSSNNAADKSEKQKKKNNDILMVEAEKAEKKSSSSSSALRLWSEEDEIVILKGMLNYKKKGLKPSADMAGFLDSIKDSLHVDVSKDQLMNKSKRLRQKYQSNVKKERNGEELIFAKGHEKKSYELSKKIWGDKKDVRVEEMEVENGGMEEEVRKENGKASRKHKDSNGVVRVSKKAKSEANGKIDVPMVEEVEKEEENELANGKADVPNVEEVEKEEEENDFVLHSANPNELMKTSTKLPSSLGEFIGVDVLRSIESSKAKEFEQRWRDLKIAEAELYLDRIELIREQTEVVMNALKSSKS